MADETPVTPEPATAADDLATWTTPPAAADTIGSPADEAPAKRLSAKLKAAGILGTAVAVGFVGVLVMQGGSSAAPGTNARGGFGGPPGGTPQGFRGGFQADRGVQGTVSAVSSSSITVAGTTVKVTGTTQVVVNGTQGSINDVKKGDTAFVHTEGSGSSRYAERIFVGGLPQGRPGFGPPPGAGPGSSTNGSTTHT